MGKCLASSNPILFFCFLQPKKNRITNKSNPVFMKIILLVNKFIIKIKVIFFVILFFKTAYFFALFHRVKQFCKGGAIFVVCFYYCVCILNSGSYKAFVIAGF